MPVDIFFIVHSGSLLSEIYLNDHVSFLNHLDLSCLGELSFPFGQVLPEVEVVTALTSSKAS